MHTSDATFQTQMIGRNATFFLLAALWLYALGWAWIGHPIYRDQHMGAAIEYAAHEIDLLRPVIVGFNANGTATPQELPIWQAAAAIGLRAFGGWWGGATIVSLILITLFLPCFYFIAKWETNSTFGWLALAMLLAQPIVFQLAGGAQTDGLSLALFIGFVWAAERLRRQPDKFSWAACAAMASLLAVTKFPFLLTGSFASLLMLLWNRESLKKWILLAAAGAVAAIVFIPWTMWCDVEIGRALFKYRPMTISENPEWFFGSLAYRLEPANYIKAGWRALGCLWGSFVLAGLTLYGVWLRPRSLGMALLIGALATTLIFTKLILIHRHYYLMFAPAIALLNTYALGDLLRRFGSLTTARNLILSASLTALLFLSVIQGLENIEALTADSFMQNIGNVVRENTIPSEKLLIINGGWGGDLLIHAGRKGLSVDDTKLAENPQTRQQLRDLGYTKVVIVSQSPLLWALQAVNPGTSIPEKVHWSSFVSANAKSWPTVFQSDDVLIKKIPQ